MSTNIEVLAQSIVEFDFGNLSDETIERARCHVLDALTTVGASNAVPSGNIPAEIGPLIGGSGEATVVFTDMRTSPAAAAFSNTQRSVALDFGSNLFYSQGLPGMSLFPALALGEQLGVSGRDLLEAVVCGFEVAGRVVLSMPVRFTRSPDGRSAITIEGLRTRWIAFGGAAAVAKLLKLSVTETANALALAGSTAPLPPGKSLLQGGNDSMAKYGLTGAMAFNAVVSGLMAQRGYTGDVGYLEGGGGFYDAMGVEQDSATPLLTPLTEILALPHANFKRYPTGSHNQQGLHVLSEVFAANSIAPDDVTEIWIGRSIGLSGAFTSTRPPSYTAAQFSMPYCAAMVCLGVPPLEWDERIADEQVLAFASRVVLEEDPVATSEFMADFETFARDPWQHRTHVIVKTRRGDFDAWSDYGDVQRSELEGKFNTLIATKDNGATLFKIIDGLESLPDVRTLTDACR